MSATFRKIASVTVGSGGAANIDFTSIPGTYTDLLLKLSLRCSSANTDIKMNFNSVTTNYSRRNLQGNGSSASSSSASDAWIGSATTPTQTASTFASYDIYIPNYAGSTNKCYSVDHVQENNATDAQSNLIAGLWSDTSVITSLSLLALSGSITLAQHSTATLYGISKS